MLIPMPMPNDTETHSQVRNKYTAQPDSRFPTPLTYEETGLFIGIYVGLLPNTHIDSFHLLQLQCQCVQYNMQ
jgi:hypothetical protein